MGLEAATYISQLVATNPVGATDPRSQGDDHLRLLKAVLQNTLPALSGAVTSTHTELSQLHGGVLASIGNGALAAPAYSFASDADSGIFRNGANDIRISAGATFIAGFQLDGSSRPLFYVADGVAAQPSICFGSDPDTGIYSAGANQLGLSSAGSIGALLTTASFSVQNSRVFLSTDGAVGTPSYSFVSDTNTGIYRAGSDDFTVTAGGADIAHFTSNAGATPQFRIIDGVVGNPAFAFHSDPDTGIYRRAANDFALVAGGAVQAVFTSTFVAVNPVLFISDGAAAAPAVAFNNDPNTGIFRSNTDTLDVSCGGVSVATFDNVTSGVGQIRFRRQLYLDVSSGGSATAGAASALPANPVGYLAITLNGTQRRIPYYGD